MTYTGVIYSHDAQSFFRCICSIEAYKVNFKKASPNSICTADLRGQQTALSDVKEQVAQHLSFGLAE